LALFADLTKYKPGYHRLTSVISAGRALWRSSFLKFPSAGMRSVRANVERAIKNAILLIDPHDGDDCDRSKGQ
jgi:hypothetical protein